MMKNIYLLVFIFVFLVSCNDKEKERIKEENKISELLRNIDNPMNRTDHFQIDIEALVEKPDNFQLFYTEDYLLTFSGDSKITKYVKDSSEYQIIRFDLDKNIFPERYRFDIGSNRNLRKIDINSISIRYKNKEVVIPKDSLDEYLIKNEYISGENGNYILQTIDKNEEITYDPFFLCSPKFVRLLYRL